MVLRTETGQFAKGNSFTSEMLEKMSIAKKGKSTWNKGIPMSDETKSKLSKVLSIKNPNKSRPHTEETKEKISNLLKGRKAWNKGLGSKTSDAKKLKSSKEYKIWRDSVFERDNYTCQKYGEKGGRLHPHHILNFAQHPELRLSIDNGITLSVKAHKEFHSKYGKRNNTREQLNEFLGLNKINNGC